MSVGAEAVLVGTLTMLQGQSAMINAMIDETKERLKETREQNLEAIAMESIDRSARRIGKAEACRLIGISIRTFDRRVESGEYVKGAKAGACYYWSLDELQPWIDKEIRRPQR